MARENEPAEGFNQKDHQAAYIFDPDEGEDQDHQQQRPSKKRRVGSKNRSSTKSAGAGESSQQTQTTFVPLLNGAERPEFVQLREKLYEESWLKIDARIQNALRESNSATLDQVTSFVGEAQSQSGDKIPAALIVTGTNIASQNLLFEQLSESLQQFSQSKFVRLRSSEATTLKATLKKVIRDATDRSSGDEDDEDDDDLQVSAGQDARRGYLDYDLEALHAFIKPRQCEHVFIAIEDSEGFDSGLLSELIPLLNSWRPRIPFALLFGIATSVELLQARLLKSACQQIYGAQFDAVRTGSLFETIFKIAVVADDVPVRIGASLLRGMVERQHDQVAGIQAFISSLRYAYMCHFYANALSPILYTEENGLARFQPEHVEAIRNTASYRGHMEALIEQTEEENPDADPEFIFAEAEKDVFNQALPGVIGRRNWVSCALRALLVLEAAGALNGDFSSSYVDAMDGGIFICQDSTLVDRVRRMDGKVLSHFLRRAVEVYQHGEENLNLGPSIEAEHGALTETLATLQEDLTLLQESAAKQGTTLRSKYAGQNKIMRTTVIAKRVQLTKDSAALSEDDKKLTDIVDQVTTVLVDGLSAPPPQEVLFSEAWIYDSKSPSRDVFVPRPRVVFERGLSRPHDYLGCECCCEAEGQDGSAATAATLPATAILYRLYLETGNLINVADLWAAFHGIVSQDESDERKVLVQFYQAMAELRALGFVKASKKKADHIAKLKWL